MLKIESKGKWEQVGLRCYRPAFDCEQPQNDKNG